MLGSLPLEIETRHNFVLNFLSNLYLFHSTFLIIVWNNGLHDLDERICSLATGAMKMGQRHFYDNHRDGC